MATTATSSNVSGNKPKGKLGDQAAIAALYATKNPTSAGNDYLDSNNRLSSAGAAASLKYANPQDLPSFPSHGLKNDDSAAGAAASLGWSNQKSFEHWKPDPSASASAAAVLAKDYKMKPLWQPEQSHSGARAAVTAHKENNKVEIWRPESTQWGNSAASQAFKNAGLASPPPAESNVYVNRQGSLMAATGAMSSNRKRAESTPIPPAETYPDARNASGNALKAAMSVHKRKPSDTANLGGASPYTNMPKEMFTSNPPVAPEVEELNRQNTLRASAVAMAKGMYAQQQKSIDAANQHSGAGAKAAHKRSSSIESDEVQPMYLGNVQEAARKLAQERLAKLHNEHAQSRASADYREYYGHKQGPSRLSIRGRTRRRASSDGTYDEDQEQSNKIRTQMSMFSSNLSQVDEQKRTKDRENLIAIAQKNVTDRLHGMDEKVFADTGKVAPSLLSEWELKAHKAAQADSAKRMENYGKVNIGGGKFINQSAVDLIAAKNVQPVLDEINEKAAIERERQATIKAEQLEYQRKMEATKQREKENKEIHKKLKQQDKDEEKARKVEEKAAKDEEKRLEKEKRKSIKAAAVTNASKPTTEGKTTTTDDDTTQGTGATNAETKETQTADLVRGPSPAPIAIRTSMEDQASLRMREVADKANPDESTPLSPSKGNGNVKTWLKSKLSTRRKSKSEKSPTTDKSEHPVIKNDESNTVGLASGAALATTSSHHQSTVSLDRESSSDHDVALAGKPKEIKKDDDTRSVSSLSSKDSDEDMVVAERVTTKDSKLSKGKSTTDTDDDEFSEARDNFDEDLIPTPVFPSERKESPARDSKFKEEI